MGIPAFSMCCLGQALAFAGEENEKADTSHRVGVNP